MCTDTRRDAKKLFVAGVATGAALHFQLLAQYLCTGGEVQPPDIFS